MMKVTRLLTSAAVFFGALINANFAYGADWKTEVREIASFRGNEIRRWDRNPRYLFVGDEAHLPMFQDTIAMMNEILADVSSTQIEPFVHLIDQGAVDRKELSSERRYPINDAKEAFEFSLLKDGDPIVAEEIDVLVSVGSKLQGLKLAFDFLKKDALTTAFARGNVPCFFGLFSDETSIKFGFVLINSEDDPSFIQDCFYEELMQSLGMPKDYQDAEHFTFDNLPGEGRPENDVLLVQSLYGRDLSYGDSVEGLIQAMEQNRIR